MEPEAPAAQAYAHVASPVGAAEEAGPSEPIVPYPPPPAPELRAEVPEEPPATGPSLPEASAHVSAIPEVFEPVPGEGKDLAAELKAAEETVEEEVRAILTGVLDRLGAAHHRPFSRS